MNTSSTSSQGSRPALLLLLALVLAAGCFLRVKSFDKMIGSGFDENHYARYVGQVADFGLSGFPKVVDLYIEQQKVTENAYLPPTRAAFLLAARVRQMIWPVSALEAVRDVSTAASIGLLLAAAAFTWRARGPTAALAVSLLLACAPMQIYMAHRALIDGFFGFLTLLVLWSLWELLRKPGSRKWLAGYFISLVLLVLTKENAAFVFAALLGMLALNRWCKFGEVARSTLLATLLAPLAAVLILSMLAGGFDTLLTALLLNVHKSYDLPRAINTGDGPWFRYLSDLLLTNPAVLLLAIGGTFLCRFEDKRSLFLVTFLVLSYALMGNLRYGMNLRYGNMWDFPLCWLATLPLFRAAENISRSSFRAAFLAVALLLVGCSALQNYRTIFIENSVYDPVPAALMRVQGMIK